MMGTLQSRVPALLQARGWTAMDLIRHGLAFNTSYRLARGEISVNIETARRLVEIFGLEKLDDVFIIVKDDEKEQQGA